MRFSMLRALVLQCSAVVLVTMTAGCSSDSNSVGTGDGGTTPTPGAGGTCDAKQARLSGSIDGTAVEKSYESNGFALVLKDFSGLIGTQGNVKVVLAQTGASSAGTPIASGVLKMPTEGPMAGESFCVGGGSLAKPEGSEGYTFSLSNLSRLPDGADAGACPGVAVSGSISGCVHGSR